MRYLTCDNNNKVISIRYGRTIAINEVQCDTGELRQIMTTSIVYDDVEQPILDENGDYIYQDGDQLLDEFGDPILDENENPTYEQILITETIQVPRNVYTFEDDPLEIASLAIQLIEKQKKEIIEDISIAKTFDITAEVDSLKIDYTDLCNGTPVLLKSDLLTEITDKNNLISEKEGLLTIAEADAEKFLNIVLTSKGVW